VAAKLTYTGLRGKSHRIQLRKVLIASPQAVRYFFVNAAVDEDV